MGPNCLGHHLMAWRRPTKLGNAIPPGSARYPPGYHRRGIADHESQNRSSHRIWGRGLVRSGGWGKPGALCVQSHHRRIHWRDNSVLGSSSRLCHGCWNDGSGNSDRPVPAPFPGPPTFHSKLLVVYNSNSDGQRRPRVSGLRPNKAILEPAVLMEAGFLVSE